MNDHNETKDDFKTLLCELDGLLVGRDIDVIIPALTVTLGEVLAETGQDKAVSIKFVINSIIKIYEVVDEDEEDESC